MKMIEITVDGQDYCGRDKTMIALINPQYVVTIRDCSYQNKISDPLYERCYVENPATKKTGEWYKEKIPAMYETVVQSEIICKGYSYTSKMSVDELKKLING